jgi:hypothetical protein
LPCAIAGTAFGTIISTIIGSPGAIAVPPPEPIAIPVIA